MVILPFKPDIVSKLASLYSDYCVPGMGINPFPVDHWEAVFARPDIAASNDVIIASRPDSDNPEEPATFCWIYSKPAPSHAYLRGPYLSPDDPNIQDLLDFIVGEAVRHADNLHVRFLEGRAVYIAWKNVFARLGFTRMGAYEKYRLFPLKGTIRAHEVPDGGTIRKWQNKSDITILMRIFESAFKDHWDFAPPKRDDWEEIAKGRSFDPDLLLVAEYGGEAIGYVFGQLIPDLTSSTLEAAYLVSIGLDPDFRGKGWGKALVSGWLRAVYDTGTRAVELDMDETNETARSLYEGFGFRKLRTEEVWRYYMRQPETDNFQEPSG